MAKYIKAVNEKYKMSWLSSRNNNVGLLVLGAAKEWKFKNLQLQFLRYVIGHIHESLANFSQSNSILLQVA